MAKKNKKNSSLPEEFWRYLGGIVFFILAVFLVLSNQGKGGVLGAIFQKIFAFFCGKKTTLFLPPFFFLVSFALFFSQYRKVFFPVTAALLLGIFGLSGFFSFEFEKGGGKFGLLFNFLFTKLFGPVISPLIFFFLIFVSLLIFFYLVKSPFPTGRVSEGKISIIKKMFSPSLKIKAIPSLEREVKSEKETLGKEKIKPEEIGVAREKRGEYTFLPLDLLEEEKGMPSGGDTKTNAAIIKKTLENFGISAEMGEINIGPTVTQYTLKPAEGIKLSKITSLSNDLALALAAHPIRIEAPIPGKSLVGIEVPNKVRTLVRLRDLFSLPQFKNSPSPLTIALGRDVSGNPVFSDLAKMPHLLVAGATGTGKTIFLNSLILSLVYRNSPEILNFILIDPKRVEFPVYNDLPHILNDVIFDVQKTVNSLKWLIEEMERRFEILALSQTRDITGYNRMALERKTEPMPYIVLIIDELADLMAARGKEIEAAVVRLAQMARAVGIHLVLATQRPSTEVITGLIKANITSRVTFQVASQIDSRTVIDTAGAEKLLGQGDMLFLSTETLKPKRIQGAFVSEKEVKRVVEFLKSKYQNQKVKIESLERKLAETEGEIEIPKEMEFDEDPLYEEAKRVVIEAKKASASLLQRRLKIGYARAARLLDILEKRGIVGPAQGAKPREVYFNEEEGWEKI
jgi:S-DNA-T family DNA segregation ATPase FtsK/SpoIIIE